MAILFGERPSELGNNTAYEHLMKDFQADHIYQWNEQFLIHKFGKYQVGKLKSNGIVSQGYGPNSENLILSFKVLGSNAEIVLDLLSKKLYSFKMLQEKVPGGVSANGRLKDLIIFLIDFEQAFYFIDPTQATTYIVREGYYEADIDAIYKWSLHLEERFRYQVEND